MYRLPECLSCLIYLLSNEHENKWNQTYFLQGTKFFSAIVQ